MSGDALSKLFIAAIDAGIQRGIERVNAAHGEVLKNGTRWAAEEIDRLRRQKSHVRPCDPKPEVARSPAVAPRSC